MTLYCSSSETIEYADLTYQQLNYETQGAFEAFVYRLVERASRKIDRYCQRPSNFFSGGSTITEVVDAKEYYSTGMYPETERADTAEISRHTYQLSQTPVVSVTSVHKNTAAVGETDSWEEITKYRKDLNTGKIVFASAPSAGILNLRFIYVAGYSTIPDEIKWACEEIVANALRKIVQDSLNIHIRFTRPTPTALGNVEIFTDAVKEMLEPYRKVNI